MAMHGMQKVRGSNPLSSTIFRMPVRGKSAKLLALDHGLTWANAQPHIAVSHADGRGLTVMRAALAALAPQIIRRLALPHLSPSAPGYVSRASRPASAPLHGECQGGKYGIDLFAAGRCPCRNLRVVVS